MLGEQGLFVDEDFGLFKNAINDKCGQFINQIRGSFHCTCRQVANYLLCLYLLSESSSHNILSATAVVEGAPRPLVREPLLSSTEGVSCARIDHKGRPISQDT